MPVSRSSSPLSDFQEDEPSSTRPSKKSELIKPPTEGPYYALSDADWHSKNRGKKLAWTAVMRTEGGEGLEAARRCKSCERKDVRCMIYTDAARRKYNCDLKGYACARCRFSGKTCSFTAERYAATLEPQSNNERLRSPSDVGPACKMRKKEETFNFGTPCPIDRGLLETSGEEADISQPEREREDEINDVDTSQPTDNLGVTDKHTHSALRPYVDACTVLVGADTVPFLIHPQRVWERCPEFVRKQFGEQFAPNVCCNDKAYELPTGDATIFSIFVGWLYTRQLIPLPEETSRIRHDQARSDLDRLVHTPADMVEIVEQPYKDRIFGPLIEVPPPVDDLDLVS